MNTQARKVIEAARRHIGVRESPPNSNNVIFNTVYYGRPVSGSQFPWCAVFVWYVFREVGLSRLYFGGERTAYVPALLTFARRNGLFHASGFKPGDLAIFDWSGRRQAANHIGIITEVRASSIVTIEGNTSIGNDSNGGQVMERVRATSLVTGVYRPEYEDDKENESNEEKTMVQNNQAMSIDEIRAKLTSLAGTGAAHSDWAQAAVGRTAQLGLFNGDGAGNFGWGQLVTREALAQVIHNLLNILDTKEEG